MNRGIGYAVAAYVLWGLLPVYWKWLQAVPAVQLIGHRIVWSCVMLLGVIAAQRRWPDFRAQALTGRVIRVYWLAAALIGLNWLTYTWAVNAGYIIETSLGYFINPLLSVLLGVVFLRERLRLGQWLPIGLAAAGVVYLTVAYGSLPWIALTLALTFAVYGLVKKVAPLNSLYGLTLETGLLLVPALGALGAAEASGQGAWLHSGLVPDLLMIGAGLVTTVPLLLFASAAQRIPLSLVGILHYIAPTLQFLLGVLVYREPFSGAQWVGFSLVWVALILFGVEGVLAYRARRRAAAGS